VASLHEALEVALRERLKERPGRAYSPEPALAEVPLREAAVLVPLFGREGAPHLLFTQRPLTLRHHAGQISFPGGSRDPGDASALHTALRETEEELGLPPSQVEILGELDELPTITGFRIRPFVGVVATPFSLRPNPLEIEQVIEAPLTALLDPTKQRVETHEVLGAMREIYFYDYGPHVIWGATARIVRNLFAVAGDLLPWGQPRI
jgi:8-oxo-dGTP pyrophosphatase MutT (NUDIX family)